jgi:hypothetical protein
MAAYPYLYVDHEKCQRELPASLYVEFTFYLQQYVLLVISVQCCHSGLMYMLMAMACLDGYD